MLKYIKKAYIMSIASYLKNGPSATPETKQEKLDPNNITQLDEIMEKMTELAKHQDNPEYGKKIQKLLEKRGNELSKISSLNQKQKAEVMKIYKASLQKYAQEVTKMNKGIQETIAKVKEYNNQMRTKADQFVQMANANRSLTDQGLQLVTDGTKVYITDDQGMEKKAFFTIPTLNAKTGKPVHGENLSILEDPQKGFKKFVKGNIPNIKTFDELGEEVVAEIDKKEQAEKLAKNFKKLESYANALSKHPDMKGQTITIDNGKMVISDKNGKKITSTKIDNNLLNGDYLDFLNKVSSVSSDFKQATKDRMAQTETPDGKKLSYKSGKDSYLPSSLARKGYTHRLTLEEVAKAVGGNSEAKLKAFQEKHKLGADGKIGTKTYKYIVDNNINKKES